MRREPAIKMEFTPHELAVLKVLEAAPYKLSTGEVATYSRMGWQTAKNVLKKLKLEKRVKREVRGNRDYWRLI